MRKSFTKIHGSSQIFGPTKTFEKNFPFRSVRGDDELHHEYDDESISDVRPGLVGRCFFCWGKSWLSMGCLIHV